MLLIYPTAGKASNLELALEENYIDGIFSQFAAGIGQARRVGKRADQDAVPFLSVAKIDSFDVGAEI